MVRCARCGKPLTQAFAKIGAMGFGPKCAKAIGFTLSKKQRATLKPHGQMAENDKQMELFAY